MAVLISTCDFRHKNFIIRLFALEHFFGSQNVFLFDYRRQPVQGIVAVFRFVSHFSRTKSKVSFRTSECELYMVLSKTYPLLIKRVDRVLIDEISGGKLP